MTDIKTGTRIEVCVKGFAGDEWEAAQIAPWRKMMGPKTSLPAGYYPVRFADGGCLMVHESGFRVVSND